MAEEPIGGRRREPLKPAEVCSLLGIQPYVLKFWEAEIPLLGDRVGSRRRYGHEEVEIARAIRECLVDKRMTLREAREVLRDRFPAPEAEPGREEAGRHGGAERKGGSRGRDEAGPSRVRRLEKQLAEAREALERAREQVTGLEERVRDAEEDARRFAEEGAREREAAREREEALAERVASLEKILAAERAAREKALAQASRVPELLGRIASLEADVERGGRERDRLEEALEETRSAREDAERRAERFEAEAVAFRERLLDDLAAAREELGGLHGELDALLVGLEGPVAREGGEAPGPGAEDAAEGPPDGERQRPETLFDS